VESDGLSDSKSETSSHALDLSHVVFTKSNAPSVSNRLAGSLQFGISDRLNQSRKHEVSDAFSQTPTFTVMATPTPSVSRAILSMSTIPLRSTVALRSTIAVEGSPVATEIVASTNVPAASTDVPELTIAPGSTVPPEATEFLIPGEVPAQTAVVRSTVAPESSKPPRTRVPFDPTVTPSEMELIPRPSNEEGEKKDEGTKSSVSLLIASILMMVLAVSLFVYLVYLEHEKSIEPEKAKLEKPVAHLE
jgi:hypothetical protein